MTEGYSHPNYLSDIIGAAEKCLEFVNGMDMQAFLSDERTVFAVIRCLEIIGEATRQTSSEVLNVYPQILWPEVIGFRNQLIHNYRRIDFEIVWDAVNVYVPELLAALSSESTT